MARRSRDWNEGLAKDLQNPEFARDFLLAVMEEGVSVQVALGKVIRAFGVKEFAKKAKLASSNVLRSIDPEHNPTQETLSRILKPLGLMITVAPIPARPRIPKVSRKKARA
jgi:probable addiction module antidote protein